jgi:hypothetical protein
VIGWKRFLELYHEPLTVVAKAFYRHHTGGQDPSAALVEDAVADAIKEFHTRSQHRYDAEKGRFRSYIQDREYNLALATIEQLWSTYPTRRWVAIRARMFPFP